MRLVIKRNELLQALQIVQRAVPVRTTKPVLYGILLKSTNTNLQITSYDMEIGIHTVIQHLPESEEYSLQIEEEGEIVLNAKYLIEIVKKLPQPLLRMDVQDLTAIIHSGKATYTLNGMDPKEYPELPELEKNDGLIIQSDTLRTLIDHTVFAVSNSDTRAALTGVLVKYYESTIRFISTDSHRLSVQLKEIDAPITYEPIETIIPGKSLQELSRILPDDDTMVSIFKISNKIFISYKHTIFYSRLIDASYPDVSRIIPTSYKTLIHINGKKMIECIERAGLLAKDNENQVVRIHLKPSYIEVSSHSPEIGKITETIESDLFSGENMLIACNAKYLMEALRALGGNPIKIEFTGPGSAFVLTDLNDDHHKHLILPVRTSQLQ